MYVMIGCGCWFRLFMCYKPDKKRPNSTRQSQLEAITKKRSCGLTVMKLLVTGEKVT